jgi:hypothetical protein
VIGGLPPSVGGHILNGIFDIYCLDCHQLLGWRKVEFWREDMHPDWTVEVFCGCGLSTDGDLKRMAMEESKDRCFAELETAQQNALDAALSPSGNDYFATLAGMGPAR